MARKQTVLKDDLLKAAFDLARDEGYQEVTATKLASKAGCSTQPIFRAYANMEEVLAEVIDEGAVFFEKYYDSYPKIQATPFLNLGLVYISFAEKESNLFKLLFMNEGKQAKSLYELLNGKNGNLVKEINKAKDEGCADPQGLFMRMWIFIHGIACMTIKGDYDLGITDTIQMLKDAYNAFK